MIYKESLSLSSSLDQVRWTHNLINSTRSVLRGDEGTRDRVNEDTVQMSMCECVFLNLRSDVTYDLMVSFGFNGQVHHYMCQNT